MILDMLEFAFEENDDMNKVLIKGNQISIYCLSLVQRECRFENKKEQFQIFDRKLGDFIDARVKYLKN